MSFQQIVMWAVVLLIGLPASWRNITAAALVVSWALAQGSWLITDDNLPIDFYFMADIAVIAIIYGKTMHRCGPKLYDGGWHQAKCLVTDLTTWDRAIVGLFVLCIWPAYVLEFDAYAKWHLLWLATILQFVFAGAETLLSSVTVRKAIGPGGAPSDIDGLRKRAIPAQVDVLSTKSNCGKPALCSAFPANTSFAALVAFHAVHIPRVYAVVAFAKVRNAIVGRIAVDVVDRVIRPAVIMHGPRGAMSGNAPVHNSEHSIALTPTTSFAAGKPSVPDVAGADAREERPVPRTPVEFTGFRFVAEKLTQGFRGGYFGLSHSAVLSHGGQGRATFERRSRPAIMPQKQPFLQGDTALKSTIPDSGAIAILGVGETGRNGC